MDTAKDARVLVLEDALHRLNEVVSGRRFRFHIDYGQLGESLKTAGPLFYEIKYSYMDAAALAESGPTRRTVEAVSRFREVFESALSKSGYSPGTVKERLVLAEVEYSLRTVEGFPRRLRDCPDDPAFAVDILAVEVTGTRSVPGAKNLTECRSSDGTRVWGVVTNIPGIAEGERLACAVLPPVEMMGVVSEAMFLGAERLSQDVPLGLLPDPPPSALDHARAQVLHITKRY